MGRSQCKKARIKGGVNRMGINIGHHGRSASWTLSEISKIATAAVKTRSARLRPRYQSDMQETAISLLLQKKCKWLWSRVGRPVCHVRRVYIRHASSSGASATAQLSLALGWGLGGRCVYSKLLAT